MPSFEIQERKTTKKQEASSERAWEQAACEIGETVYAVVHLATSLEFYFAYIHRDMAECVAEKFNADAPAVQTNFCRSFAIVSAKKAP